MLLADDLGWADVSWHNPAMVTPHLQQLASLGATLNTSYFHPKCSPSRWPEPGTPREHQTRSLLQGGAADRLLPAPAGPPEVRRGPLPRLRAPPPPHAAARAAARRGLQLAPGGQVAPGLLPARAAPQPPRVRLLLRAVDPRGGLLHQGHTRLRGGQTQTQEKYLHPIQIQLTAIIM